MELTIDQALQQAMGAHAQGQFPDAERLYRAILQVQPNHPDANHNLGVLMVAVFKPEAALPFFLAAHQANPNVEQFWLSYIACHIKTGDFDGARRSISDAKRAGTSEASLSQLEQELESNAHGDGFRNKTGLSLKEKRRKQANKKRIKKRRSDNDAPPQQQLDVILSSYQAGDFKEATELANSLIHRFPLHPFAWQIICIILYQSGKLTEALSFLQKSAALSTGAAPAQINLGNVLSGLGRFEEAAESYTQAVIFDPDSAEAHGNLGNALSKLGRLEEATSSFERAIFLKPDYADFHRNWGTSLIN